MTYNQIQRAKLEEEKRHNTAMEAETHRSNITQERLREEGLSEEIRSNQANEAIKTAQNAINELKVNSSVKTQVYKLIEAYGWDTFLKDVKDVGIIAAFENLIKGNKDLAPVLTAAKKPNFVKIVTDAAANWVETAAGPFAKPIASAAQKVALALGIGSQTTRDPQPSGGVKRRETK